MRPLNRPMFRYGGPIKQGIMSGIREPKKNGGSMREKQGKYLVGDPIYPKTDGRAHHAIFGGVGVAAALAAAGRAGMRYIPQLYRAGKRIFGKTTPASITKGGSRVPGASGSYTPVTINPAKFTPNSQELKQWCLDMHDKYNHVEEETRKDTSFASEVQKEPNDDTKMIV